jgi:Fasciclin domain
MLKRTLAAVAVVALLAVPVGSASAAPSKNIVETAAAAPQFSTLVSLVKKAGLVKALSGKQKLTVFAPTNAAFKKVPKKTLNALLADRKLLRKCCSTTSSRASCRQPRSSSAAAPRRSRANGSPSRSGAGTSSSTRRR